MTGKHRARRARSRSNSSEGNRTKPFAIVVATGVVSLLNYAFGLVMLWALPARQYSIVASVTALLLIFGTVAGASAPWVLAREVALSGRDAKRRRRAIVFAGTAAFAQAAMAALACLLIVAGYASWETTLTACSAAVLIFLAAAAVGYLQGTERIHLISFLRTAEAVLKVLTGVTLVEVGLAPWGAVSGFAFGALLVFLGAFYCMGDDMSKVWKARRERWIRSAVTDRTLWASARGIMGIQAGTAVIAGLDLVIASIMLSGRYDLANYQVVQVLGRIPFYIASSLAIIVFPRMARTRANADMTVATSLHVWIRVCGGAAIIVATLPGPILVHILPARYGPMSGLLPWAALTGLALGGINFITTYWQAVGRFKSAVSVLLTACLISGSCDVLSLQSPDTLHLAWSAAGTSSACLCGLLILVRRDWPRSLRGILRQAATVGIPGLLLWSLRMQLVPWCVIAFAGVLLPTLRSLLRYGGSLATERPTILHLAFEDPRRPGSGGGSVRTHEIDRRLSRTYDVTVVCARFPGSQPRTEHGVRYVHIGLPWGQKFSLLSYFLFLPWALVRFPGDLVIEDFAAPFSSVAVPWMTSRPVIGVVQWLFAEQKAAEYKLPFHLVERIGIASHRHLVAVSEDLGTELRYRNPRACVSVIQNGLPDEAFLARDRPRSNILYLGRLEVAQKGIDLLVQAFAQATDYTDRTLTIAGSGPDEAALRALAHRLGVADRVCFLGHVAPSDRFDLLASAELVAMPSRYETFGMVAAEALAVGTPVVAFDIPCLRSILSPASGVLVPPFDTSAFAAALVRVLDDDRLKSRLGRTGKATVDHLRWDGLASAQEHLYSRVLVAAE